ncbi:hypothetical protein SPTER_42920 [Sporomusa termitida]|uniref:Uncharacterized protein n=1 Tax=Sporomusa termitida TaxID=2377 RepID=A0A517DZT0_9FIRM|nr:hypothetical protein SPTER_42920 [Sporomusa termitida]
MQQICQQCKTVCGQDEIRCPRCHKLLRTYCDGSALSAKQKRSVTNEKDLRAGNSEVFFKG